MGPLICPDCGRTWQQCVCWDNITYEEPEEESAGEEVQQEDKES